MATPLFNILVGAALLLLGRRLFWLFVAGVGFVVGTLLATELFGGKSEMMTLVLALALGIIGALVSLFLQKAVIAIAGFLAGGYLLYTLAFALKYEPFAWLAFLLGGIIGAILVLALFDWALIALSSLIGATVISRNVTLDSALSALLFVVLLILGVVVQARQLSRSTASSGKAL